MALIHEKLSDQFYNWEMRGRGWTVFPEPVRPEPPFRPFEGHYLKNAAVVDDGRRPTFLSSLVERLAGAFQDTPQKEPEDAIEEEPEPEPFEHSDLVELRTILPAQLNIPREAFQEFLASLSMCQSPISFEITGTHEKIALQFASDRKDSPLIHRQLEAHFPEGTFSLAEGALRNAWYESECDEALIVEFGLEREFMHQLRIEKSDPFVGIVGVLSKLAPCEIAAFQVLFEPVRNNWRESIERSVCHADGKPFFVNAPELAAAGKRKTLHQLYAAVVRIAILSGSFERTLEIARDLAGSFRAFANPQGNELIPLQNDDYPFEAHVEDFLNRQSRRSGMVLTSEEIAGFVHLPSAAVRSPSFLREGDKTKACPGIARSEGGVLLGTNIHAGTRVEVRLTPEQRVRHMHLIGASGTGKSMLLFNLIRQDIENNQGIAVLDPHGDLIDRILTIIPSRRIKEVILVDPSDEKFSVGFNILSAHSDLEKTLLASDLVSVFQRLSTAWGDQMGSVLQNAILAFLESDTGGTLADMRQFLIEPAFRTRFLKTVRDPDIVYYWQKGFAQLAGNRSIGSVLTRLETFLAPKPIRYMVSQAVNRLDFASVMDSGKIFLAKLPQGKMGKENSFLLGSLFVSKFQQTAMSRQDETRNRRDFWLYLDEFHNFITPSMAEILSGARKYRLGLILAHQELRQLDRDRDVASAVLTNPFTRFIFRVGDSDARHLERGLSFFEASDLQNLETGQAICRVEKAAGDFNLTIPFSPEPSNEESALRRKSVIDSSRKHYGTPRAEVEAALRARHDAEKQAPDRKDNESSSPADKEKAREQKKERQESPEKADEASSAPQVKKEEAEKPESAQTAASDGGKPQTEVNAGESPSVIISEAARKALETKPAILELPKRNSPQPRESGKGGAQHKILQRRIKEAAEAAGFDAVIEKEIPNSQQTFDVHLERNDLTIACEISFATTIDWEVGNVSKCLKAGVGTVAVICLEDSRLNKIKFAVDGTFSSTDAARVAYFTPTEFLSRLEALKPGPLVSQEDPAKRKGRRIRRVFSQVSASERQAREDEAYKAIAEMLRRKAK